MFNAPTSARFSSSLARPGETPVDDSERGQSARLLEGELGDLYGAIMIVIPLAIFLKSLWF